MTLSRPTSLRWTLAIIIAAGMTHARNQDYHSAIGMWEDVVAKTTGAGQEHLLAGRLYNNLGNAYADQEQWDKSLTALERAVEEGTFSGPTYANLARGYLATGQLQKAKAATLKAIERQPKNARVRQQLGLIAVRAGAVEEALEHFLAASRLDPNDRVIMANVAQAYLEQGRFSEAGTWLDKVLELEPDNRDSQKKRILLVAQRGEFELADTQFQKYLAQYPEDAEALQAHARVQLALVAERPEAENEAVKTLKRCVSLPNTPRGVHFLLANVYRQRGDLSSARKHYEKETRIDPSNVDAWNNLAGLTMQQNPAEAIAYFEKVLSIAPDYHQAAYNIAIVQASNGQLDAATQQLENLLDRTEFPPARQLLEKLKTRPNP